MSKIFTGKEKDVNLVLYGALAVEYAAIFLAKSSLSERMT